MTVLFVCLVGGRGTSSSDYFGVAALLNNYLALYINTKTPISLFPVEGAKRISPWKNTDCERLIRLSLEYKTENLK